MDFGFANETAIVTASSGGLGRASAASLAREDANVVICGRTPSALDDAQQSLDELGAGTIEAVEADITNPGDIEALLTTTVDAFGGIDHVVTSAGGVPAGSVLDAGPEDWQDAFDMLVMSVVELLQGAHTYLQDSDAGTVTAITSTSVAQPIDGIALSNSVRRTVIGIVQTIASEWGPDVRANAVLPGPHATDRLKQLVEPAVEDGTYDSLEDGLAAKGVALPLERIGDPQELGDTVAFLASDRASFITGISVPVDGGRLRQ